MKKTVANAFAAILVSLSGFGFAQAQCPAAYRASSAVLPYDSRNYKLPFNIRFKIKLDNAVKSSNYRTGDIVKFQVIENVYGLYVNRNPSKPEPKPKSSARQDTKPEAAEDDMKPGELMLVIPKGAQGFGRVNYAKLKSSFYYRGKAKIYVIPEYVQTDDGRCFDIRIPANEETVESPQNIKPCKYQSSELKKRRDDKTLRKTEAEAKNEGLRCIEGRREKIPFATGLVGAVGAGALALVKDNATSAVAGLTLINSASSNSGISSYLSGRDAEIGDSLVFEVELVRDETGYIKGEPPKKEDKAAEVKPPLR